MDEGLPRLRENTSRIGILGGTFDPPHYGHLLMAETARLELKLDQVFFVPAGVPPHKMAKDAQPLATPRQRLEMIQKAIADNPFFEVWDFELKNDGPDYTIKTLDYLKKNLPGISLYFIMGKDSLGEIFSWKNPREILTQYDIIVVSREGDPNPIIEQIKEKENGARLHPVVMPAVNISSTELRRRVKDKGGISYLTPPAVEEYILKNRIYL